jgi:hypothetical protein
MKTFTWAMIIAAASTLLFLSGCSDEFQIANPPLKKGFVSDKRYIPATTVPIQQAIQVGNNRSQIMIKTPEIFLIVIGVKEDSGKGYNINKYSFYQVSPVTFGELSIDQEVNTEGNEAFKIVEVQ